jgi:hypothetical protein
MFFGRLRDLDWSSATDPKWVLVLKELALSTTAAQRPSSVGQRQ